MSQFADDTTILLDGSAESLNATLNDLLIFTFYSGLKLNFDKTKVVWIGKHKFSSASIKTRWKLIWNQQTFDLLGLKFHIDLKKMIELNFTDKMVKVKNILKNWSRRILTPVGRIQVIKHIGTSDT